MRKDIFTKSAIFFLIMLAILVGQISFVFFVNHIADKSNYTATKLAVEPAAVNGGGRYIFENGDFVGVNSNWYLELYATGDGWIRDKHTGQELSANITYVDFNFRWGSNVTWWNLGQEGTPYYVVYLNGKKIKTADYTTTTAYGRPGKEITEADICEMGVSEGEYRFEFYNTFCNDCGNWFYHKLYNGNGKEGGFSITLNVDRTAPELVLEGVSRNGTTKDAVKGKPSTQATGVGSKGKSWSGDSLTMKYGYSKLGSSKPTSANKNYSSGQSFSAEGYYCFMVTDSAGNNSELYHFTIDTTKPQNNFTYQLNNNKAYTSENIIFNPTDNFALDKSWVKFEDGPWVSSSAEAVAAGYNVIYNGNQITVPNDNPNGNWYFKASDTAGNFSDDYCVVLNVLQTFGNQATIRDSYKSNYWYNVVLPANIFGIEGKNIAGTYHAPNYETALAFARAKEWEYRVSVVSNGWMYVNVGNENLAQLYTDKNELDAVVEKYAKGYVKERSIAKNGTNNFSNIINYDLYLDSTALTRQQIAKPDFLDKELPVYMMQQNYCFIDPQFPYQTFVKIQMVANDFGTVEREEIDLIYGQSVADQVLVTGNNSQGYYLVTEWDSAGNTEEYYVYIDLSAPALTAEVVLGNNTKETVVFDEAKIKEFTGTFRYLSLNMQQIADSVDHFVAIKINGRKLTDISYVQGDVLPVLDGVEFYGNYTVELYDRSGNTLNFTVTIAGEAPMMTNSSLSSDTSCRLTLNVTDRNNSITDIKLFYITFEGEYQELTEDHKGVPVNASTLQYTLTTGGKYTLWYTDLFGREVYCPHIFYLKGLPTGILSGVMEGGITNKNVSLKYSDDNTLILYRVENGNKTEVLMDGVLFGQTYDETTGKYTATIMANEDTSASYVFFLHRNGDKGLFVEYAFSIDCIIAPIYISNVTNVVIDKNSYSNKPFTVYWEETLTLRYYTSKTAGGEMGAIRYTKGNVLSADGTYFFILRDSVGNEERFTILLDAVVSYELGGEYVTLGEHKYISKNDLQFSITESTAVKEFTSIPDVVSGGFITLEGTYTIWITDAYGNSAEITITIDRTAPTITMSGVGDTGATNSSVQVNFTDYVNAYLVNSRDQYIGNVANGQIFDTEGTYRIMVIDVAGNTAYAVFSINRTIPYESNVMDGTYTTGTVSLHFLGTLATQKVFCNEEQIESANRYTEPGKYNIMATDVLGNNLEFSFTILPARVQVIDLVNLLDYELVSVMLDGVSTAASLEEGKLYLDANGEYTIKMKNTNNDNVFEFTIEVDNIVLFDTNIVNGGLTTDMASLTFNEDVKQTVTLNDEPVKSARQYTKAGNYKVTATDNIGNVTTIIFTILPKVCREICLEHLDNYELVLVTLDTKTIKAEIVENTLTLTKKGMYGIMLKIKDTTEVFGFGIEVDNVPPTVEIKKEAGSFKTQNASKENLTATLFRDDKEVAYTIGKKVNGAGNYTLTIVDELGNENVYHFTVTEPLNWAAYASIAGLGLLVFVAVLVVFLAKRRVKIR